MYLIRGFLQDYIKGTNEGTIHRRIMVLSSCISSPRPLAGSFGLLLGGAQNCLLAVHGGTTQQLFGVDPTFSFTLEA